MKATLQHAFTQYISPMEKYAAPIRHFTGEILDHAFSLAAEDIIKPFIPQVLTETSPLFISNFKQTLDHSFKQIESLGSHGSTVSNIVKATLVYLGTSTLVEISSPELFAFSLGVAVVNKLTEAMSSKTTEDSPPSSLVSDISEDIVAKFGLSSIASKAVGEIISSFIEKKIFSKASPTDPPGAEDKATPEKPQKKQKETRDR